MKEVLNRSDFCSLCLDKRTGQGQITTSGFRVGPFNWYLLFTYVQRVIFYNSLWLDSNRVWINSWNAEIRYTCHVWSGKWYQSIALILWSGSAAWNWEWLLEICFECRYYTHHEIKSSTNNEWIWNISVDIDPNRIFILRSCANFMNVTHRPEWVPKGFQWQSWTPLYLTLYNGQARLFRQRCH